MLKSPNEILGWFQCWTSHLIVFTTIKFLNKNKGTFRHVYIWCQQLCYKSRIENSTNTKTSGSLNYKIIFLLFFANIEIVIIEKVRDLLAIFDKQAWKSNSELWPRNYNFKNASGYFYNSLDPKNVVLKKLDNKSF